jgi:tetratricopeptide (TPR) repeat protein
MTKKTRGFGADDLDDLYEILSRAYASEDDEEVAALAGRALELDPDNPEALLFMTDLLDEDSDEERLSLLEKALARLKRDIEDEGLSGGDLSDESETGFVYLAVLQRMAYLLFTMEQDDRSMEIVEELLTYDYEDRTLAKTLYYRILLERGEWGRALEETLKETTREMGWAYARLLATFMLAGAGRPGRKENAPGAEKLGKMLWDAVRMSPNVPFYMLGYFPDPVEDTEEEEDDFHFALLFEGIWAVSLDLLNWFSSGVILFGLLTGRFGDESEDMREILDSLGFSAGCDDLIRKFGGTADDETALRALIESGYPNE